MLLAHSVYSIYTPAYTNMPRQKKSESSSSEHLVSTEDISLYVLEAFKDKSVFDTLVSALIAPITKIVQKAITKEIAAKLESIDDKLRAKDAKIDKLQNQVTDLEKSIDDIEQYGRRQNLRIHGVPETTGEVTDSIILSLTYLQIE